MNENKYKGILGIDFDGTIAKTTYPEIHEEIKDAKKYINKLHNNGWFITIWTCRHDNEINSHLEVTKKTKEWLNKNNIHYDLFNENHPFLISLFGESRKVSVDFYIDDKHITGIPSWKSMYKKLSKLKDFKSCLHIVKE